MGSRPPKKWQKATTAILRRATGKRRPPAEGSRHPLGFLNGPRNFNGEERTVNQPPYGVAGSSPACPTSLRSLRELRLGKPAKLHRSEVSEGWCAEARGRRRAVSARKTGLESLRNSKETLCFRAPDLDAYCRVRANDLLLQEPSEQFAHSVEKLRAAEGVDDLRSIPSDRQF